MCVIGFRGIGMCEIGEECVGLKCLQLEFVLYRCVLRMYDTGASEIGIGMCLKGVR